MNIYSAVYYTMSSLIICFETETEYPGFNPLDLLQDVNYYVNTYYSQFETVH